ncbi:MAG: hypothetical protein ABIH87_03755 [bacterium]
MPKSEDGHLICILCGQKHSATQNQATVVGRDKWRWLACVKQLNEVVSSQTLNNAVGLQQDIRGQLRLVNLYYLVTQGDSALVKRLKEVIHDRHPDADLIRQHMRAEYWNACGVDEADVACVNLWQAVMEASDDQ